MQKRERMTKKRNKSSLLSFRISALSFSFLLFSCVLDTPSISAQPSSHPAVVFNDSVPADLLEIVGLYSDISQKEINTDPDDVLSFLMNAYSEHGYHESGNWSLPVNIKRYVLYKGELPDYEMKDFRLPILGRMTSIYGYRPKYHRFHRGVDLALNTGDTVACALPGVVTLTGYDHSGYGCFVVVSHAGDVETLYGHLQLSLVNPGQKLEAGEAVGLGGASGNATGPHLHFETRYKGFPIDPISWFNLEKRFR